MSKTIRKGKSNISKSAEMGVADTSATEAPANDGGSASAPVENQQTSIVSEETIRELAHSKWEAAGCPVGDGTEFWLKAEVEVRLSPNGVELALGK